MALKAKHKTKASILAGVKQLKTISSMLEETYSHSTGSGAKRKTKMSPVTVAEAPAIYKAGLGKSGAKTPLFKTGQQPWDIFAPAMKPKGAGQANVEEEAQAEKLVRAVEKEDATDVNALCGTYGLKRDELGRLTGFSLRALAEWSAGKRPSTPAQRRLREVRRLLDSLAGIVRAESIPGWLHRPNPAFENHTPLQVIEVGETDRLWQMVYGLGSDAE